MSDRDNLVNRAIPHMSLASPSTTQTPGTDDEITPRHTSSDRFSIPGTAIITGGTGALGTAVCHALLQHGSKGLAIFDVNTSSPASREQIASLQTSYPSVPIHLFEVDVTDEAAVQTAVTQAKAKVGGAINALVCTAGIVGCAHALDISAADMLEIINVNTVGTFSCARAVAKEMVEQGTGGRIVFTASISAHRVNYPQPQAGYNTSKGALLMLAKSLAAEWARYGIRVNTVSPGYLDTVLNAGDGLAEARSSWCGRNPSGRMGRVEETAAMIVALLSPAGSYVNGTDIVIDGGGIVF